MITYLRFAAVALIPALINTALAVHFFTTPARNSLPYYNDEIAYWNQVATFREAGFDGGYITANERVSRLTWSRFGPHGPTFPAIYGSLARVTGWRPSTAVDLNLFLITAAAFVWLVSTRPPLLPAIVLLATYWPLAFALTTTMQEPLQYALVLLLAAAIVRGVRAGHAGGRSDQGLVRSDSALVRPDQASVRPDQASVRPDQASVRPDQASVRPDQASVRSDSMLVRSDQRSVRSDSTLVRSDQGSVRRDQASVRPDQASVRPDQASVRPDQASVRPDQASVRSDSMLVRPDQASVRADAAFGVLITIASLLRPSWALLMVPYLADRVGASPTRRWAARAAGVVVSVAAYALFFVVLGAPYPGGPGSRFSDLIGNPAAALGSIAARLTGNIARFLSTRDAALLEVFFRYEALVVGTALVVLVARRRTTGGDPAYRLLTIAAWFLGLTVAGTLVAGDIESWRDYRVLTPVLFLTLLLAVNARWRPAAVVVAAHLVLLPAAAATFASLYEPKFRADRTLVATFADEAASVISFQPGAPGWRNTVLVPVDRYEYPLLGIPAGIGASSFFGWEDVALPLKSRYVLLRPAERERAPAAVRLKKLRETVHGTLYENLDSTMSPAAK